MRTPDGDSTPHRYDIPVCQSIMLKYTGVATGPVRVKSTNDVKIFTGQRVAYRKSFNERMGIPADQLTTNYWFTYYDDIYMTRYLMIEKP